MERPGAAETNQRAVAWINTSLNRYAAYSSSEVRGGDVIDATPKLFRAQTGPPRQLGKGSVGRVGVEASAGNRRLSAKVTQQQVRVRQRWAVTTAAITCRAWVGAGAHRT